MNRDTFQKAITPYLEFTVTKTEYRFFVKTRVFTPIRVRVEDVFLDQELLFDAVKFAENKKT